MLLESGDLVLFDGMSWHGVDKIIAGTAPQWWKDMKVSCTEISSNFLVIFTGKFECVITHLCYRRL